MRKTLVLDATPLIYLTRAGFWKYLPKLGWKLATTRQVVLELRLDENQFPEAMHISVLIKGKALDVLPAKAGEEPGLSSADVSVILLARRLKAVAVVDDEPARRFAAANGIATAHSTALLIDGVRRKAFSGEKALELLDAMVDAGWYCDVETYKNIAQAIRKAAQATD
ncbi:MAG: hypothetical protein V1708_03535 [Candidatus Micrarchaeota archaeon]